MHLLRTNSKNEEMIVYPVSNYGVIYNINSAQQTFLSYHTNMITSCIVSSDKELLILGDSGASNNKSIISIWNCHPDANYDMISSYQLPPNFGVQSLAINDDKNLLSAIINESVPSKYDKESIKIVQHLIIWSLSNIDDNSDQDISIEFKLLSQHKMENRSNIDNAMYHSVTFKHNSTEIVTHGENLNNFIFWTLSNKCSSDEYSEEEHDKIELTAYYTRPNYDNMNNLDLNIIGNLTQSVFLPITDGPLITGTNNGDLIIWEYDMKKSSKENLNNLNNMIEDDNVPKHRILNKIVNKMIRGSINCVTILNQNDIIVLASSSGSVRFHDFEYRVIGWLDYLGDQVISISFPQNIDKYADIDNFQQQQFMVPNNNDCIL